MRTNLIRNRRRLAVLFAAALATSAGLALAAQPAAAATPVIVPAGCGAYSGLPVPAGWTLDDHSQDGQALGNILGAPHQVGLVFGTITIGTPFADHIQGNNITGSAVDEVICGIDGEDWIKGGSGNDEIFGGVGADSLWGEEGGDLLSGSTESDVLYGDDFNNSHGNLDLADTLQGGAGNDFMYGGAGPDLLKGGPDVDFGDGQGGADTCTFATENGPC